MSVLRNRREGKEVRDWGREREINHAHNIQAAFIILCPFHCIWFSEHFFWQGTGCARNSMLAAREPGLFLTCFTVLLGDWYIFYFSLSSSSLLTFNNLYDVALSQKLCAEMMRLSLVLTALLVGGTSAAVNLDVSSEVTAHKYVSECTAPPYFRVRVSPCPYAVFKAT